MHSTEHWYESTSVILKVSVAHAVGTGKQLTDDFQAGSTLFKVPAAILKVRSQIFSELLEISLVSGIGTTDDNPIVLNSTLEAQFKALLDYMIIGT